ncbi:MAG: hypothetical protein GOVbin4342_7 [Prokaryotic dsDNA virus sp.]|nr:MAG: hypothetical protein GOVbin4342_7 [Prokaryotic dsDNA virus sp.]|tara:strand:+ start:1067 stop:1294 length:228 start_codon:yes stop_codon:yes gene_type:complete
MEARTLKQVNKAIHKKVGNVILCKSEGCFFVSSDDNETGLKLASLETTSIYVCHLNHQSVEEWVEDVRQIVSNVL